MSQPQQPQQSIHQQQPHPMQVNQQQARMAPSPSHMPTQASTLPPSMPGQAQQMHRYTQQQNNIPQQMGPPAQQHGNIPPPPHPQHQMHVGPNITAQRVHDLLSEIQSHFDGMIQENQALKAQTSQHRDDIEIQITQQIEEMNQLKRFVADLERVHVDHKSRYEQEIANLRRELEARGGGGVGSSQNDMRGVMGSSLRGTNQPGFPDAPPPQLGNGPGTNGGAFGPLIGTQGNPEHRLPSHPMNGPPQSTPTINGLNGPLPVPSGMPVSSDHLGPPTKRIRGEDGGMMIREQSGGQPGVAQQQQQMYWEQQQQQQQFPGMSQSQGTPQQYASKKLPPGKHSLEDNGYARQSQQWNQSPQSQMTGQMTPQRQQPMNQQVQQTPRMPQQQATPQSAQMAPMTQQQQPQQAQQPAQQQAVMRRIQPTGICDLFDENIPREWKKENDDWSVMYNLNNPSLMRARVKMELEKSIDHNSVVCCVKFSNDGRYLATGCNFATRIVDVSNGQTVCVLENKSEKDDYVRSISFSPDSKMIATGTEDRVIRIWDIKSKTVKFEMVGHDQDIYCIDWSRDGKVIVSGSGDKTVKVWDAEKGTLMMTLRTDQDPTISDPNVSLIPHGQPGNPGVTGVAIRGLDCRVVVAGSLDKMVRLWDLRTGRLLERFESHQDSVYSVAFSPDGQSIASGSLDGTIIVWDLSPSTTNLLSKPVSELDDFRPKVTTTYRQCFAGHRDFVLSVAFAGTNASLGRVDYRGEPVAGQSDVLSEVEWVVSASKDKHVVFWDARGVPSPVNLEESMSSNVNSNPKNAAMFALRGHGNSVISVALSPNGGLIATGSGDSKARIWRVYSAEGAVVPAGPQRPVKIDQAGYIGNGGSRSKAIEVIDDTEEMGDAAPVSMAVSQESLPEQGVTLPPIPQVVGQQSSVKNGVEEEERKSTRSKSPIRMEES
ncbi:general transcription repressor [Nowakowskiella sp. JEL0407]|nr:general transcription repressor [Nowakowskiella sp. JEL0407]